MAVTARWQAIAMAALMQGKADSQMGGYLAGDMPRLMATRACKAAWPSKQGSSWAAKGATVAIGAANETMDAVGAGAQRCGGASRFGY